MNDLSVDGLRAQSEGECPVICLRSVHDASVTRTTSPAKARTFLLATGGSRGVNLFGNSLRSEAVLQEEPADTGGVISKQGNRSE